MTNHIQVEGVLGGGGVKGFCHIGFLKACREENVSFSSLLGVSVGSLVAALHCNGYSPEEIRVIFADRLRSRLTQAARAFPADMSTFTLLTKLLGPRHPLLASAFRAIGAPGEEAAFHECEFEDLRLAVQSLSAWYPDLLESMRDMVKELKLKPTEQLKVLAFDAIQRKPVLFEGTDYDLALALTASCALPGAFRPVLNPDGRGLLIDGAMYHRNPVDFCKGKGLVSKLGFASAWPSEVLSPIEFIGHVREMLGLTHYQRHEVDTSTGHIVVEMKSPQVAGMSFGISTKTQDAMVEDSLQLTLKALRDAKSRGAL